MSSTDLFYFNKRGYAKRLGSTKNSWRGAMAIWNIIGEKYLPPHIPYWATDKTRKYDRIHLEDLKPIWELFDGDKLPIHERIVLGSTFDNVVIDRKDFPALIEAFRAFEGETSLKEQADIIEEAMKNKDVIAIAWNQTSVNGDTWTNTGVRRKNGNSSPYNIFKQNEHYSIFKE